MTKIWDSTHPLEMRIVEIACVKTILKLNTSNQVQKQIFEWTQ